MIQGAVWLATQASGGKKSRRGRGGAWWGERAKGRGYSAGEGVGKVWTWSERGQSEDWGMSVPNVTGNNWGGEMENPRKQPSVFSLIWKSMSTDAETQ